MKTAERVTGKKVPVKIEPRRPGDPARLVASAKKARKILSWKPQMNLEQIIQNYRPTKLIEELEA